MKQLSFIFGLLILVGLLFIGCENTDEIFKPFAEHNENSRQGDFSELVPLLDEGAVYTMTNDATYNEIVVFHRNSQGVLNYSGNYSTEGQGSIYDAVDPLASQGSIAISDRYIRKEEWMGSLLKTSPKTDRWLCAVNAGSNNISVFAITEDGLDLRDVENSGGVFPVSLTIHNDLLYILNRSDMGNSATSVTSGNINGFRISKNGKLAKLENSQMFLSNSIRSEAAQIQFSPDGKMLVVTEKETSIIDIFIVGEDGRTDGRLNYESSGTTPFGFAFDYKGHLFVAESFENIPYQGAASLYELGSNGELQAVSRSLPTHQTGSSKAVVTQDGKFAYVANTQSGTISGFSITGNGSLEPINEKTIVAVMGKNSTPTGLALSTDSRFLYVLDPGIGIIHTFKVQSDGTLKSLSDSSELIIKMPLVKGFQGLAAY